MQTMSKLIRVSRSKYRAVISDILPYERPVFFSNRFFSRILKFYGIQTEEGRLIATRHKETEGLNEFLLLLGGNANDKRTCFQYRITKDGHDEGRCLTVIHPYHQVKMLEFYDAYKNLLIDFCQRSNFSIRYPYKISSYQKRQKGYHKIFSDDEEIVDSRESLKHFFAYKFYRNINLFYGDYRFLRSEKKFKHMTKIDLKHCFESIKPESLSKAMFGCDIEDCNGTLAYDFYILQKEFTDNGIVIGPEFSRIYAEIILQKIDFEMEKQMNLDNLVHKKDYQFYRYVDDGYLFYNEDSTRNIFIEKYSLILKEYNLRINEEKTLHFAKPPFLENISTAKSMLTKLTDSKFENKLETFRGFIKLQKDYYDTPTQIDYKLFVNELRSIIKMCGVDYKDVTSFLLGLIQKRLLNLLEDFNNLYKQYTKAYVEDRINAVGLFIKDKYESEFIQFSLELIEILFYLLSCDMRMSTSIKIISITNKIQLFVRGIFDIDEFTKSEKFPPQSVCKIDEKISDEISSLFMNSTLETYNVMELLNILELEKIMSPKNQISAQRHKIFFMNLVSDQTKLNFFVIFEILHFIKNNKEYEDLKSSLLVWIDKKLSDLKNEKSETESVLTLIETLCCPWIDDESKIQFSKKLFPSNPEALFKFTSKQKELFIKWNKYKLNEAIQHINSPEVY